MTVNKLINKSSMIAATNVVLDVDAVENALLHKRAKEASEYLLSFRWCRGIKEQWFAGGFSQIAVFFFEIDSVNYDSCLWVIVGDLPPAHLVIDDIPDFTEALLSYVFHMRQWVEAAKNGRSTKNCIPVNVKPTPEYAAMLESRLNFIESIYVPSLETIGSSVKPK
jgi:hypothetical protein